MHLITGQVQKQWFVTDEDNAVSWGRPVRACIALLLLVVAPYHLAHDFDCSVCFQKSSQYHGLRNADTSSVLEDPHGSINLLLMHGTIL
jgi:hypothetical protein